MTALLQSVSVLLLGAQAQAVAPLAAHQLSQFHEECGIVDGQVIDARGVASSDALASQIDAAKSGPIVLFGVEIEQLNMTALAPKLAGGCIIESNLPISNWAQTYSEDLTFVRTNLYAATFSGADLSGLRLIGTGIEKADFSGSRLTGGAFVGAYWKANLADANFSGADLSGFKFSCGITMDEACNAGGASFAKANLAGADFADFPSWGSDDFTGAKVDGTRLHPRALVYFEGLDLVGDAILSAGAATDEYPLPSARLTNTEFRTLQAQSSQASNDTPSFDCSKASTKIEALICAPYESALRRLDRDMAKLWKQARAAGKSSLPEQRAWLRSRSQCDDRTCLMDRYEERVSALIVALGSQFSLAPDASIEFDEDVLPLPPTARRGDVYARLLPVLKSASFQSATLTGLEDGRISATGDAVGGNAHMCSLSAETRYDPETGWYGADGVSGFVPLFRIWDERLFFRYSGNLGDTPFEAGDYISCGARAGFSTMRDLSADLAD